MSKPAPASPSLEELSQLALAHGISIPDRELTLLREQVIQCLGSSARLEEMSAAVAPVGEERDPGRTPGSDENQLGAWAGRCSIKGTPGGPLTGKRIAIKDSICVRGLPMTIGSAIMAGYVADEDATVVSRVLAAGAEIVGKATCENLCVSGGSHTAVSGPVRNPYNPAYSAGGSSSGNAVLIASGECELGIGGDAGGSIRMPAALTGVFGLKPTYGLVPCTGAFPIESSLDHVGPMAATTLDLALLLNCMAGADGLDAKQLGLPQALPRYEERLDEGVGDLKLGLVVEGFNWVQHSDGVRARFSATSAALIEAGARVEEISIPAHEDGIHIFSGIAVEGGYVQMIRDSGLPYGSSSHYPQSLLEYFASARRERAGSFSDLVKVRILAGALLSGRYHGRYYALARQLARGLSDAYDRALSSVDVLMMPTAAPLAVAIPLDVDSPIREFELGDFHHWNTAPFNVSGHPALSVPCGFSRSGLPVGLMLIGKRLDEATLLRVSQVIEDRVWLPCQAGRNRSVGL